MILKIGNFAFQNCCVGPRISRLPNFNAAQQQWSYVERWDLEVWLLNPTGSQTMIANAEKAFQKNGVDVILYQPDGKTKSAHQMLSRNSFGGTQIVQRPQYEDAKGAEHVTYRTFQAAIAATFLVENPNTLLKDFTEEISFAGGGPRFGHLEPLIGLPVKQLRKQNTIYRATQSGHATGIIGFPTIPFPVFPDALIEAPDVVKAGPVRIGGAFTDFMISWSYRYEAAFPLFGNPTPWFTV
jgi:hypothetical protein